MRNTVRNATYACALILKDGKALLGRRSHFRANYPNCWDFIGGKVEEGEEPEQTLKRELGEELAINPLCMIYFYTIEDIHVSVEEPPTYLFFRVENWEGGEPTINNHEHSDLEWFSFRQACDLSNLALPEYRALLKAALR
ncbi:MAG: NUDIX domain-containing protein [Pseudomonadota bacterium]